LEPVGYKVTTGCKEDKFQTEEGSMKMQHTKELTFDELSLVGGGTSIEWSTATTAAAALLAGAVAVIGAPVLAGALAAGSIASSGAAIYYALEK